MIMITTVVTMVMVTVVLAMMLRVPPQCRFFIAVSDSFCNIRRLAFFKPELGNVIHLHYTVIRKQQTSAAQSYWQNGERTKLNCTQ